MRTRADFTLQILALASFAAFAAAEASRAEMPMKHSAATTKRSAGLVRRTNDLGARSHGRHSDMTTSRDSQARSATSRTSQSDANLDPTEETRSDDRAAPAAPDDSSRSTDGADTLRQAPDDGERTLGRACIYGRRGQVLFRPAGGHCRGDPVEQPTAKPRAEGAPAKRTAPKDTAPRARSGSRDPARRDPG